MITIKLTTKEILARLFQDPCASVQLVGSYTYRPKERYQNEQAFLSDYENHPVSITSDNNGIRTFENYLFSKRTNLWSLRQLGIHSIPDKTQEYVHLDWVYGSESSRMKELYDRYIRIHFESITHA